MGSLVENEDLSVVVGVVNLVEVNVFTKVL